MDDNIGCMEWLSAPLEMLAKKDLVVSEYPQSSLLPDRLSYSIADPARKSVSSPGMSPVENSLISSAQLK